MKVSASFLEVRLNGASLQLVLFGTVAASGPGARAAGKEGEGRRNKEEVRRGGQRGASSELLPCHAHLP